MRNLRNLQHCTSSESSIKSQTEAISWTTRLIYLHLKKIDGEETVVCCFCFYLFRHNVEMDPTGDLEKKFDLEISPMCNQQADTVPAIQTGESVCHVK